MQHTLRRWALPALLTLAAVCAFVAPAHAGWTLSDVRWRHFGRGDLGFSEGSVTPRGSDTLYVSAAPARVDTSASFSMLDAEPFPVLEGGATATTADSAACGYVMLVADSATASSVNFKNTTVTVQVNYGDNSSGWQNFASAYSVLATDGQKTMIVPLYQRVAAITTDLGIDYALPNTIFAPSVRVFVTWGTSAAAPQCRIRVKKWVGHQTITRQDKDFNRIKP